MKVRFFCDNNANIHSRRSENFTLEQLGYTEEEWKSLSQEYKDEECRSWAMQHFEFWIEELD